MFKENEHYHTVEIIHNIVLMQKVHYHLEMISKLIISKSLRNVPLIFMIKRSFE